MRTDVVDLRDFYATSLGQAARRIVRTRLRDIWPDVRGMTVVGLGYATPFLAPFRAEAARAIAAMPASQGVLHWPHEGPGLTALIDEIELPFPDLSIDRLVLVHYLETAEQVRPLMREAWRVLTGEGRLMVVAPNRRGLWARFEHTPFGHGRPYSQGQLNRLLRECMFTPTRTEMALYLPPVSWRVAPAAAPAWERLRAWGLSTFAGVVMVEASKQVYAAGPLLKARRRAVPAAASRAGI
ncbi:MAG: methyltransferase domain-containing protein [Rhodospirillales bacterium]|nr:methyltransferase domain-containing protein [Rhodospirillales bacterium]MSP79972.1 methyltransferase domain-containing protein [Rhodospirillales bacterium]